MAETEQHASDNWRLRVDLEGPHGLKGLLDALSEAEIAREARAAVPRGVIISRDGEDISVYAGSAEDVHAARPIIERAASARGMVASARLERWDPVEERWEPPAAAPPASSSAQQREHDRLMAEEAQQTAERGYAQWEIDVELPDHHQAREAADRLRRDGIPARHGWRYIRVGAATEDDARALAERLRSELPADAKISAPLGDAWDQWVALHPFGTLGGLAG